jgi:hypothetical protein
MSAEWTPTRKLDPHEAEGRAYVWGFADGWTGFEVKVDSFEFGSDWAEYVAYCEKYNQTQLGISMAFANVLAGRDIGARPVTAADDGCWLEGSRGWRISGDMVERAGLHGFRLDANDRKVLEAFDESADVVYLDDGSDRENYVYAGDYVSGQGNLADTALDWMNANVAPEGYRFGWHDGEFFLASDEWWETVNY